MIHSLTSVKEHVSDNCGSAVYFKRVSAQYDPLQDNTPGVTAEQAACSHQVLDAWNDSDKNTCAITRTLYIIDDKTIQYQNKCPKSLHLNLFLSINKTCHPTIAPLFEKQDSCGAEGDGSVHWHHGGHIWPEETLHLMLVSWRKTESSSTLNYSCTFVCAALYPAAKLFSESLHLFRNESNSKPLTASILNCKKVRKEGRKTPTKQSFKSPSPGS